MKTEDVSVVMPNFNHAQFLPRAVSGVLNQTVRPREVVVVDDGSTDGSLAVLAGLAAAHPELTVVRNARNLGVIGAVNHGIRRTSGEYLVLTAADDFLLPEMIEKSLAVLRAHPRAALSCGYLSTLDEGTGGVTTYPSGWCEDPAFLGPDEAAAKVAPGGVNSASAMHRRGALVAAGGYLPELRWACDWFLNLVMAFRDGLCHVPEPLARICLRPGEPTYSAGMRDPVQRREVIAAIFDRLLSTAYADVLPRFRRSGVIAGTFGPDVVRVAAARPDRWSRDVLGLIGGLEPSRYADLLTDPDPEVRALAETLLGPLWERSRASSERQAAELREARAELHETCTRLAWMESSKFWKLRAILLRIRRGLFRRPEPAARPE